MFGSKREERQEAEPIETKKKKAGWRETLEALLTAFVIAFLIRSFVVEPFKIPSGSMIPTLLIGDHIFVNKFAYGIRIPFTKWWPVKGRDPTRGEVAVFLYPKDESLDFIKRVVGLPGDTLTFDGKTLTVNDVSMAFTPYTVAGTDPKNFRRLLVVNPDQYPDSLRKLPYFKGYDEFDVGIERLDGKDHLAQYYRAFQSGAAFSVTVPPEHFFVMGDNRDRSADSREWGFVPRENLKGEAMIIWLSLDHDQGGVRWHRFGKRIF